MMIVLHCRITGIQTKKTISGSHQSGQKSNIKDTSENAVAFYYYSLQKLHILSGTRYIHVVIGTAAQILILHRLWNRFHTKAYGINLPKKSTIFSTRKCCISSCSQPRKTRKTVENSRTNGTVWCCRLQLVFGAANSSTFELIQDNNINKIVH